MVLVFCLLWCWCLCVVALMFLRAMVKLKGIADCHVTNSNHTKCESTNCLGVWFVKKKKKTGWACCIKALYLGNGVMGACFQAPHATPGQ